MMKTHRTQSRKGWIFFSAMLTIMFMTTLTSALAKVDVKNVEATVTTEDDPDNPDRKKVFVTVTYELEGTEQGKGAVISLDARLKDAGDTVGTAAHDIRPLDSELEGDFGGVLGDGQKQIVWDASASLERLSAQGKYDCTIDISVEGQGNDPTRATININEYDPAAPHKYFATGTIVFKDFEPINISQVCNQSDNWQTTVDDGATFYRGTITGFPRYLGNRPNPIWQGPVDEDHCSAFLAAIDLGTAEEKVWVNFASVFSEDGKLPDGSTRNATYVFQVRYNRIRTEENVKEFIKMGNAGDRSQQGSFVETPAITKYDVHIEIGKEDIETSNEFELEVFRYEYKYHYQGAHLMTFSGIGGAHFVGAGPNRITLKDGDMKINGWLHFNGGITIDTTVGDVSFASQGAWADQKGESLWADPFDATLAEGIKVDIGGNPILLAAEWAIGGFSISLEDFQFIGAGDQSTGIEMNVRIMIPQLASACAGNRPAVGGFKLEGVKITDEGLEVPKLEAQNIGVKAAGAGFCIRSLTIEHDAEQKKLDADIVVKADKFFDKIEGGLTFIDKELDRFELTVKDGVRLPIPIPAAKPGHIADWTGVILGVDGLEQGPLNITGGVILASQKEWSKLPGYEKLAGYVGDLELFEVKGTVKWTYPLVMELKVAPSILSYKNDWLTNGRKIWVVKSSGTGTLGYTGSSMVMSGKFTADVLDIGGDKPLFHGEAFMGMTMGSSFKTTLSVSGELNIPDLFTDLPVGDYLNHKFGLPLTIGQATLMMNNLQITAAAQNSCYTIDLTKSPFTEPRQFFSLCDASTVLNNRIERKGHSPLGANDTTWFEFTASPDMQFGIIQIYGDPAPASVLIDPSGTPANTSDIERGVTYYPSGKAGQSNMWEIERPEPGLWKIGVIDMGENDSIDTWAVYDPTPKFAFQSTMNGMEITAEWTPSQAGSEGSVDFFLDTDDEGFDGLYVGTAEESDGEFRFTMNDSLPECGYYVYGMRNISGQLSTSYSSTYHSFEKAWLNPPTNIQAIAEANGDVTVTWDHSSDESRLGYLLRVSDASGHDSIYASTSYAFSMATINVEDWQNKTLSIITYGEDGLKGCWSEPVSFQLSSVEDQDSPTAGDAQGIQLTTQIIPNPTAESAALYVNLKKHDLFIVELYDSEGRLVETLFAGEHPQGTARADIDVSGYESGTYFLRVTTTEGTATEKLVVRR